MPPLQVITGKQGDELSIWDSKESEFASGHEFEQLFQYADCQNIRKAFANPSIQRRLRKGSGLDFDS